jgi:hypothetical protein
MNRFELIADLAKYMQRMPVGRDGKILGGGKWGGEHIAAYYLWDSMTPGDADASWELGDTECVVHFALSTVERAVFGLEYAWLEIRENCDGHIFTACLSDSGQKKRAQSWARQEAQYGFNSK